MTVHISLMIILFLLLSFIAIYFICDFIMNTWFSTEVAKKLKVDSYNKTKDTS